MEYTGQQIMHDLRMSLFQHIQSPLQGLGSRLAGLPAGQDELVLTLDADAAIKSARVMIMGILQTSRNQRVIYVPAWGSSTQTSTVSGAGRQSYLRS